MEIVTCKLKSATYAILCRDKDNIDLKRSICATSHLSQHKSAREEQERKAAAEEAQILNCDGIKQRREEAVTIKGLINKEEKERETGRKAVKELEVLLLELKTELSPYISSSSQIFL